jgi:hypothetical protein
MRGKQRLLVGLIIRIIAPLYLDKPYFLSPNTHLINFFFDSTTDYYRPESPPEM